MAVIRLVITDREASDEISVKLECDPPCKDLPDDQLSLAQKIGLRVYDEIVDASEMIGFTIPELLKERN